MRLQLHADRNRNDMKAMSYAMDRCLNERFKRPLSHRIFENIKAIARFPFEFILVFLYILMLPFILLMSLIGAMFVLGRVSE